MPSRVVDCFGVLCSQAALLGSDALCDEFQNDEKAASAKYTGKIIEVAGVIEGDPLSDPDLVTIGTYDKDRYIDNTVICRFEPGTMPALDQLWEGQEVKIKGTCEFFIRPHLERCAFSKIGDPLPVIKVKAGEMINEFYEDEDAATMKYDGKVVEVEGLVAAKGEGGGSLGCVAIKGDDAKEARELHLRVNYVRRHEEMISNYNVGDNIKVKGTCSRCSPSGRFSSQGNCRNTSRRNKPKFKINSHG